MADFHGRTALVTGASGGIGLEIARVMARDGWDLVLAARDGAALDRAAGGIASAHGVGTLAVPVDLSVPAGPDALRNAVAGRGIRVDALVNNAGFGAYGPFASSDMAVIAGMMELNMASLVRLTGLFVGGMVERRSGHVLNVSSIAGFVPGPYMAVYHATKAFVTSFSEALGGELRGSGVTVTALCPGPVRTGFASRAGARDFAAYRLMEVSAAACARAGYRGMLRGRPVVIPGVVNRLAIGLSRLAPRRAVTALVGGMQGARRP